MDKKMPKSIIFICIVLACSCLSIGYVFVIARQFEEEINFASLFISCLATAVTSIDFAWCWHSFIMRTSPKLSITIWGKMRNFSILIFLCPSISAFFLYYITSGNPFEKGWNSYTLTVCMLNLLVFTALNCLLTFGQAWLSKRLPSESNIPQNDLATERVKSRFVIVLPMVFISIQNSLLGSCLAISTQKNFICIFLYCLVLLYLALWVITISCDCAELENMNTLLLLILTFGIVLYFFQYYTSDATGPLMDPSKALAVKVFALAIFGCSSVSLPALMDLSWNIEAQLNMSSVFVRHHGIISFLTGVVSVLFYTSWVFMAHSYPLLFAFAFASTLWVHIIAFRREPDRKKQHIKTAVFGPLLAAIFLCLEFAGWFSNSMQRISMHVGATNFPATISAIISIVKFIKENRKHNMSFSEKMEAMPIFWAAAFSHLLTSVFLLLLSIFDINSVRANSAGVVLIAQIILEFVFRWLALNRKSTSSTQK